MIPLDHGDRANRADPYTEPNSCFSDSSDSLNSLNSLNSMKVPLHLEKTPLSEPTQTGWTGWTHTIAKGNRNGAPKSETTS